jgi:hypothetical protein
MTLRDDISSGLATDANAYLQLSELIVQMDDITNLMLSDIPKNNLLN